MRSDLTLGDRIRLGYVDPDDDPTGRARCASCRRVGNGMFDETRGHEFYCWPCLQEADEREDERFLYPPGHEDELPI